MELVSLLTRIEMLKSQIDALRPLDPWREKQVLQRFRNELLLEVTNKILEIVQMKIATTLS